MSHVIPTTHMPGTLYRTPTELCSTFSTIVSQLERNRKWFHRAKVSPHVRNLENISLLNIGLQSMYHGQLTAYFRDKNVKIIWHSGFLHFLYLHYSNVSCTGTVVTCRNHSSALQGSSATELFKWMSVRTKACDSISVPSQFNADVRAEVCVTAPEGRKQTEWPGLASAVRSLYRVYSYIYI
jgi:hypothetical protein